MRRAQWAPSTPEVGGVPRGTWAGGQSQSHLTPHWPTSHPQVQGSCTLTVFKTVSKIVSGPQIRPLELTPGSLQLLRKAATPSGPALPHHPLPPTLTEREPPEAQRSQLPGSGLPWRQRQAREGRGPRNPACSFPVGVWGCSLFVLCSMLGGGQHGRSGHFHGNMGASQTSG